MGELANFGAPVVAVEKGQGDVQQHQLGVEIGELGQNVGEIRHAVGHVPPPLQVVLHHAGDDRVVLYNQNTVVVFHKASKFKAHGKNAVLIIAKMAGDVIRRKMEKRTFCWRSSPLSPIVMTCYLSFWQICGRLIASVKLCGEDDLGHPPIHHRKKGCLR